MRLLPATLLIGSLAACAIDPELDEVDSDLTSANKLSANKLSANKLSANKLSANKLSANSLAVQSLMANADGRDVLSYVIGCALPAGQSLTFNDPSGTAYTFAGSIGLAPTWTTTTPTVAQRHWVTACVLARTNYYGVPIRISMRSDTNTALVATTAEKTSFAHVEGAFWGDIFATTPVEYACAAAAFTPTSDNGIESLRACTRTVDGVNTNCGFTFTGYCGASYPGKSIPCTDKVAPFGTCMGSTTQYPEVITIYLPQ